MKIERAQADGNKYLIVQCDDLGLCHSANLATWNALKQGLATSASIMAPCPGFEEVAQEANGHREFDLGVHLTLTSEWPNYRWGPVTPRAQVPSLINDEGCFWPTAQDVVRHAAPGEILTELAAQVELCSRAGIIPTHINTHMMILLASPMLMLIYIAIAKHYRLPLLIPYPARTPARLAARLMPYDVGIQSYITASASWSGDCWQQHYLKALRALPPGISVMTLHLAEDDEEMKEVTAGSGASHWDGAWRQRDVSWVNSQAFRDCLREQNIKLVSWDAAAHLMRQTLHCQSGVTHPVESRTGFTELFPIRSKEAAS
jgi:predicted glycoside hydrolase/deacetylase ChbG (UPF0249 family)